MWMDSPRVGATITSEGPWFYANSRCFDLALQCYLSIFISRSPPASPHIRLVLPSLNWSCCRTAWEDRRLEPKQPSFACQMPWPSESPPHWSRSARQAYSPGGRARVDRSEKKRETAQGGVADRRYNHLPIRHRSLYVLFVLDGST